MLRGSSRGALARESALRGKRVARLPPEAYGWCKDINEAWVAGGLAVRKGVKVREMPEALQELWQEHAAIVVYDGKLPPAWRGLVYAERIEN